MPTVERVVEVAQPMQKVVQYLADFQNAEEWDAGTKSCTRKNPGPVEPEAVWENVSEFMGRETTLEYELKELTPNRILIVGENKTVTSKDTMTFKDLGANRTEVTYHADFEFHGVAKVAGPVLKPALEKLGTDTAEKMQEALNRL